MDTEIKSFKTRRTKLLNEIKDIKNEVTALKSERDTKNKDIDEKLKHIKNLENQLKKIEIEEKEHQESSDGIIITEHALLRYFERVLGFDLEQIKTEMVPEKTKEQIKKFKSGLFPVGEYKLRVRGGTIVTLLTKD